MNKVKYLLIIPIVFAAVGFFVAGSVWAWVEPGENPPAGNVAAPINVGGDAQYKVGHLRVGDSSTPSQITTALHVYKPGVQSAILAQNDNTLSYVASEQYGFFTANESVLGIRYNLTQGVLWSLRMGLDGRKIEVVPNNSISTQPDYLAIQPGGGNTIIGQIGDSQIESRQRTLSVMGSSYMASELSVGTESNTLAGVPWWPYDDQQAMVMVGENNSYDVGLVAAGKKKGVVGIDTTSGLFSNNPGAGVTGSSQKGIGVRGMAGWGAFNDSGMGGLFTYGNLQGLFGSPWNNLENKTAASANAWIPEGSNDYSYHGLIASSNSRQGNAVVAVNTENNAIFAHSGDENGEISWKTPSLIDRNYAISSVDTQTGGAWVGPRWKVRGSLSMIREYRDGANYVDRYGVLGGVKNSADVLQVQGSTYGALGYDWERYNRHIGVYGAGSNVSGKTGFAGWFNGNVVLQGIPGSSGACVINRDANNFLKCANI